MKSRGDGGQNWVADEEVQEDGTVHVYPEYDRMLHKLAGVDCPCQPDVELQENGILVVHRRTV